MSWEQWDMEQRLHLRRTEALLGNRELNKKNYILEEQGSKSIYFRRTEAVLWNKELNKTFIYSGNRGTGNLIKHLYIGGTGEHFNLFQGNKGKVIPGRA